LPVGAIDAGLESLGTGAAMNGGYEIHSTARFNLPGGFARDFRLNLVEVEVRRGGERLEARDANEIRSFVFLSVLSNGLQNAPENDWKLIYLKF
jgi:hypothetical protein